MQKISSYLYPNKINVVADVAVFPTRWNIVYQNRVKIYQGVDNVLTIDVKNSDQKRIDISGMTLEMTIMDVMGQAVAILPLTPSTTLGLATVNITPNILANLTPQFLNFTLYRINTTNLSRTILYADTQFGAKGNMELVGSAVPNASPPRYITRWLDKTNDMISSPWITTWYSDAVEIRKPNYLDLKDNDIVNFEFLFKGLDANIKVEFTKDSVISAGNSWEKIDEFAITPLTSSITRTYSYGNNTYNREWAWARVTYVRTTNNTGSIDKVIVRL